MKYSIFSENVVPNNFSVEPEKKYAKGVVSLKKKNTFYSFVFFGYFVYYGNNFKMYSQ